MLLYKNARYYRVAKLPSIFEEQDLVNKEIESKKQETSPVGNKDQKTKEVKPDAGINWRAHEDAIMAELREQLGFPGEENRLNAAGEGTLRLLGAKMDNVMGSPEFGYEITGNFETDFEVDEAKWGKEPYNFVARIGPDNELIPPVAPPEMQ